MFGEFVNVQDLLVQINSRASMDHIKILQNYKVEKSEFRLFKDQIDEFENKIKHLSVYQHELAQQMVPIKQHGVFQNEN